MGTIYAFACGLSRPVLFNRNYLRSGVIIQHCFPLERQCRVRDVERPWATGLARLLADRHLKKGDLAELAGVRAGTISAVANSPKAPDIATLRRLADGFTKHDRHPDRNPHAPAVQLWEFFISDEQAALLRQAAQAQHNIQREEITALLTQEISKGVDRIVATINGSPAPQQGLARGSHAEDAPPATLARGKLQRGKRSA